MLRRITANLKVPMYASASLSFALMGDAFLYSFLPVNALSVQLPLIWVGTILSINRFTRILLNPVILWVFGRIGFRLPTIIAAFTAVIATAGYGCGLGVTVLIFLRILWGISYSILRVSALTYAMDYPRKGLALGVSQSIIECGPLLALMTGPFFLELTSPMLTFMIVACLSVPGIYFAFRLEEREQKIVYRTGLKLSFPSVFNRLAFLSAFSVEGMLVVLIGILLMRSYPHWPAVEITIITAAFLIFRRVCSLLISPFSGWLADQYGLFKIYSGSIVLICSGLLLASGGFVFAGIIVVFTFYNINSSLAAGGASQGSANIAHAVSQNATFRDAGSAFGALAGGFLLAFVHLELIFVLCSLMLLSLTWIYFRDAQTLATEKS